MIVAEIKFGFTGTSGVLYLLMGKDQLVQAKELSDFVVTFLNQSGKTFAYTIFPLSVVFGGLLGFLIVFFCLKKKSQWSIFLATYIFAYSVALPFGGWNMKHILVGVAPAVAAFTGIFLWKYLSRNKIIFSLTLAVILGANLTKVIKENINGQTIFPLQADLVLSKETAVVDYTYQKNEGKPFSISTLTSPLFMNSLWSYLYNWYGKSKYGFLPYWVGHDQVDQLGNNLQSAPGDVTNHYFIIEPTYGIPDLWVTYAKGDQDAMSTLVSQKNFGEIVVETRKTKNVTQN
jgi:hypothetical protein